MIKTLKLGVALGVFNSDYSFSLELPDSVVLKLTGSIDTDVKLIDKLISTEKYKLVGKEGKSFVENKISNMIQIFDKTFK